MIALRRHAVSTPLGFILVLLACVLLLAAGCGRNPTPDPQPLPGTPGPTATVPDPGPTDGGPDPGPGPTDGGPGPGGGGAATPTPPAQTGSWTSGPVTVVRDVAVPPVPVLVGIRSAAHSAEGFDRIVFDFRGSLPGYEIRYVSEVRADASDQPVDVPGRRYLLVTFRPAQAHEDSGTSTVTRTMTFDYPMMRGYAVSGDFEAVLSVAIGLDDVVGYRVGELPGRIYLDVAA